jgi:hypothetical protein
MEMLMMRGGEWDDQERVSFPAGSTTEAESAEGRVFMRTGMTCTELQNSAKAQHSKLNILPITGLNTVVSPSETNCRSKQNNIL